MGFPLISCPGPRMIILISTDIPNSLLVGYNYKNCIAWLLVISTIYDPRFRFGESPYMLNCGLIKDCMSIDCRDSGSYICGDW